MGIKRFSLKVVEITDDLIECLLVFRIHPLATVGHGGSQSDFLPGLERLYSHSEIGDENITKFAKRGSND